MFFGPAEGASRGEAVQQAGSSTSWGDVLAEPVLIKNTQDLIILVSLE